MRNLSILFCGLYLLVSGIAEAATVSGRVTYNGRPVRGLKLYVGGLKMPVRSDRNGVYSATLADGGTYVISPYTAGKYLSSPFSRTVVVNTAAITGVDFNVGIAAGSFIIGRITTSRGDPLSNVQVRTKKTASVTSDQNGLFYLSNIPVGRYLLAPFRNGVMFSPGYRSLKLKENSVVRTTVKGFLTPTGAAYGTYFSGLWNVSIAVQSNTCPANVQSLDGIAGISQVNEKLTLKLPKLGSFKARAGNSGFSGTSNTYRSLCRVASTVSASFSGANQDTGGVTGTMTFSCLLNPPCSLSFSGTLNRW